MYRKLCLWVSGTLVLTYSLWVFKMSRSSELDLSLGATVYCQLTGKRCEVVRHFAYSNIDHVVVAFDIAEKTPRQITLSFRAARSRFVSSQSTSVRNKNFLPKLLVG